MKKTKKTKKKPFYHQLVKVERIYIQVKKAGLAQEEERQVWDLIEHTIHTKALDAVLEKLPSEKHEEFMERFTAKPDDEELINYLKETISDIEDHLDQVFKNLEEEITSDILGSSETEVS